MAQPVDAREDRALTFIFKVNYRGPAATAVNLNGPLACLRYAIVNASRRAALVSSEPCPALGMAVVLAGAGLVPIEDIEQQPRPRIDNAVP